MIKPGMCSVTFRDRTVEEVIQLTAEAGLAGIEWGGDRHVPISDIQQAVQIGKLTREAGLTVAGYGSYYSAFDLPDTPPAECEPVVKTAAALGSPSIRIWAGSLKMKKTKAYFDTVVQQSRRIADVAQAAGIKVGFEFHPGTFTETIEGTVELLDAAMHPNLYVYWQPRHADNLAERRRQIEILKSKGRLLNLHVYHWDNPPEYSRFPLESGEAFWPACFQAADEPGTERFAFIEFVRNDDVGQFRSDAAVLKKWLNN
ncbi:MAG: sugar phosphate isomerase/epimerase family protein [Kiritimatiellales bacterium]